MLNIMILHFYGNAQKYAKKKTCKNIPFLPPRNFKIVGILVGIMKRLKYHYIS